MDALELLRRQMSDAFAWLDETVSDVTPEQASWQPPAAANSIGATYAHAIMAADLDFSRHVLRVPPRFDQRWGDDVGLSELYPDAHGGWHDWATALRIDWPALRAYGRDVQAWMEDTLQTVDEADLEQAVDMSEYGLGVWKARDVYWLHAGRHIWMHGGEIACMKGMQGSQGYRT